MNTTTHQLAACLAPQMPGVDLSRVIVLTQSILVHLISTVKHATCPHCQHASRSRHSRYTRTLADIPWGTYTVRILLTLRKFRCPNKQCPQQVFTEQLPEIAAPYARHTRRCQDALRTIGLALGGQAGARLAADLDLPTSRDSLLRLIRATPLPVYAAPRVVGIDDWARRRGRHFGTIVVDLERQQPLALLPDRQPETVIAWLQRHPTITVVSRDRADGYAEAVRRGAPQAQQIADRWHLLKNLTEVLETWLPNQRAALEAAIAPPAAPPVDLATVAIPVGATVVGDADGQQRQSRYREQYEQIHRLHAQHLELATIARQVGVSRMTVYKYLRLTEPPLGKQPGTRTARMLAPYQPYLLKRWSEGCRNAQQLGRELIAQGYQALE